MHLKISSTKWRPISPGGDELIRCLIAIQTKAHHSVVAFKYFYFIQYSQLQHQSGRRGLAGAPVQKSVAEGPAPGSGTWRHLTGHSEVPFPLL